MPRAFKTPTLATSTQGRDAHSGCVSRLASGGVTEANPLASRPSFRPPPLKSKPPVSGNTARFVDPAIMRAKLRASPASPEEARVPEVNSSSAAQPRLTNGGPSELKWPEEFGGGPDFIRATALAAMVTPIAIEPRTAAQIFRRLARTFKKTEPDAALLFLARAEQLHPTSGGTYELERARRAYEATRNRDARPEK